MTMQILRDARLGLRLLWRQPSFTTVALLALALGVAANTAIFSVVYATLLAPLPYDNPDELVIVWSRIQNNRNSTAAGDYLDWVRLSRSFQGLHAWSGGSVSLSASGQSDQVTARRGTPGFLTTHGFKMFMGRDFLPEEGTVGKDQVVVMTHRVLADAVWRGSVDPRTVRFASTESLIRSSACSRRACRIGWRASCSCRSRSRRSSSITTFTGCSCSDVSSPA